MPALRTHDTHPAARSLEIKTSAPAPALHIIAPTPRAFTFTFPTVHNLADSPYSSPVHSPFEPDLGKIALSARPPHHEFLHDLSLDALGLDSVLECKRELKDDGEGVKLAQESLPLSAFTRTLSPAALSLAPASAPTSMSSAFSASPTLSPARISIPSAAAPVRRDIRRSVSADARRPKRGDEDYVKRPENAFILYRRKCCEDRALSLSSPSRPTSVSSSAEASSPVQAPGKKERQADLSKIISAQWKALSPTERAHWEGLAQEKKREHEALHPGYVYRPQRAAKRSAPVVSSSGAGSSKSGGQRKDSAPQVEFVVPAPRAQRSVSAPAYHSVHLPNVYGAGGGFDYVPRLAGISAVDASLQSSEFLRAMFPETALSPSSLISVPSGGVMSPVSSTSGSGPSSPYTPASACAAFHPSVFSFSCTPSTRAGVVFSSAASPFSSSDSSALGAPEGVPLQQEEYAPFASAWAASSPWSSSDFSASLDASGMAPDAGTFDFDFDIGMIPELGRGWELEGSAFRDATPGASPDFELGAGELEFGVEGELNVGGQGDMNMDFGVG
ncbi:hypothetical protein FB451DRAFT_778964 [Mycena latifolia]|nr:hypothetical protein FB451DRAFT_778964 [Mycena latifolia]